MTANWLKKNRKLIVTLAILVILLICILLVLYSRQLINCIYNWRYADILNFFLKATNYKFYSFLKKLFIMYLTLAAVFLIFLITLRLLTTLNLIDLLLASSTSMALLFSSGFILQKIMLAPLWIWNAIRLAWTFSITHGYQFYYPPDSGPVLSLLAGPLQTIVYLPATLFNSPNAALIFGSSISVSFYFFPILWLLIGKNLSNSQKLLFALYAFACFCLATFTSDTLFYVAFSIYADAPALGFGALSCAILYHRKHKDSNLSFMLASLFSVFAVWTKQTLAPILFALPTYILLSDGYRYFRRYLLYLFVSCFVVSILFLLIFNAKNLLFNMVVVPSHTPWVFSTNRILALIISASYLINESLLFLLILIFYFLYQLFSSDAPFKLRAWLNSNHWAMLAIVSLFMVPSSIFGRVRVGGDSNTLSPTVYFLAAAAACVLAEFISDFKYFDIRIQRSMKLILVLITIIILFPSGNMFRKFWCVNEELDNIPDNCQEVAYIYAKRHPGEAYFPNNPLASLLANGKLYHHAYGVYDRDIAGFMLSVEHFRAHIPPHIRLVAFPKYPTMQSDNYIMRYLPEFSKQVTLDKLPGFKVFVRE